MPLKQHIEKSLEITNTITPVHKMLLCALAVTLPLLLGLYLNEIQPAMFGSLMGLVLYLNDHFGYFSSRIKHLIATMFFLMLTMWVGTSIQGHLVLISTILFALCFLLGKSKTFGVELERLVLFITLQFMTTTSEHSILIGREVLLKYSLISFVIYLFMMSILFVAFKHEVQSVKSKRQTLKEILANKESIRFSFFFAVFGLTSYHFVNLLNLSHPYWVVGTTLIVMLPDSIQGIYKSFQRFIGTLAGVIIAAFLLNLTHDARILLFFIFCFSFFTPVGLTKNYWIGNVFIAALILFFLEIAAPQSIATHHLAFWRVVDITLGSSLGVVAAFITNPSLFKRLINSLKLK